MAVVQICDFGEKDGVKTYRVHGDKADLEKIIQTIIDEDGCFHQAPALEHVRKGVWTILLKIKVPVGVGEKAE